VILKVKRLDPDIDLPKYQTAGASCFDLAASEDVSISPGETKPVPTGLAFDIPEGYEVQIRPRSGITLNMKLRVHLGTLDSDYIGAVSMIVENSDRGANPTTIRRGDRIAQAALVKVEQARLEEVMSISETERGGDGFGSTGV